MAKPVKFFLSFLVSWAIFAAFVPHTIFAAGDFKASYQTEYFAKESGEIKVTQNVTIENLTSQYFVSQYKFTIGSRVIKNVKGWDPNGSLTPQIKKEDEETTITLKFKARVLGKGNKLKFGISYDFPDLAKKNGLVWELNLLKISGLDNISIYNLTVSVPQSFGPLLYSFPEPAAQAKKGERTTITFNKGGLLEGAPRLAFGKFQLYSLSLSYHLKNPSIGLGYTEIALPPDILGYQKIIQNSLLPSPDLIRVDDDGNYLARYNLGPLEKIDVIWKGLIALFYPERDFGNKTAKDIHTDLVQTYAQEQKYWETSAVEIKAQAAKLTNPKLSVAENLKNIYNFVTQNLSYSYQKLETGELVRLGALEALSQKESAVCMEYTDLFIALARSSGIPAREVNGYAYTSDDTDRPLSLRLEGGDVLHAWPQAYIPQTGWVMVDPTWGSTSGSSYFSTFDLSHLAFVIKGESSEYPLPAGSYKTDPNQKDVVVSLSENIDVLEEEPNLEVAIEFAPYVIAPFQTKAVIKVKN
ncbi:MAG TPA: transglutaminase domain-containing protein, partial [candidate division WWE3 bacterium]|nr:transglutaminase domain-containing protein [candidate division WWE3 bacterium]